MLQMNDQASRPVKRFAVYGRLLSKLPFLDVFLGGEVSYLRFRSPKSHDAVIGWGRRKYSENARIKAEKHSVPFICLEDGFLRSYGVGSEFATLSLIADPVGIYFDSRQPSFLENLLNSEEDLIDYRAAEIDRAIQEILLFQLSKYNNSFNFIPPEVHRNFSKKILIVDQTYNDKSIECGGAQVCDFTRMYEEACAKNPDALIYVKTHPVVNAGEKKGHLSSLESKENVVLLTESVNPYSLFAHVDEVCVVTSHMGFEALLAGKKVHCFGMPWYAGWGVTEDRSVCPRRQKKRDVRELFSAAYFHYTRYLNPVTRRLGTIFDVINFLARQKDVANKWRDKRFIAVGFNERKAPIVRKFLGAQQRQIEFVSSAAEALKLEPTKQDVLVHWGRDTEQELVYLSKQSGANIVRVEDGFFRSVGLGSELVPPLSLVIDHRGLYFDTQKESDLEWLLNNAEFDLELLHRARLIREFIVEHDLTKYNVEAVEPVDWDNQGKPIVLVSGQVEDDASIRYGAASVKSNLALVQAARKRHASAWIVYKPHPDVLSGRRAFGSSHEDIFEHADHVEMEKSISSCLKACDALHTMTSQSGFDALLRNKQVVVYGRPFYAGWGLTEDMVPLPRRKRTLSLDQLVAATLLLYPSYFDDELNGFVTCESVLRRLTERRSQQQSLRVLSGRTGSRGKDHLIKRLLTGRRRFT